MRIHIDITHPGDVHLFKNFIWEMQKRGHTFSFTCRTKEFASYLLKQYEIEHLNFGNNYRNPVGKLYGLLKFNFLLYRYTRKTRPDLYLSMGSIYAAHIAFLQRKPHICLDDTYNLEQIYFYSPFTKSVLTPVSFEKTISKNQIWYRGYHELAYLHTNYFEPNENIYDFLKISKNEKYVIIRFIGFDATHDYGHKGISFQNKILIINEFSKYAKVFITSQNKLQPELEPYRIPIPPEKIHDAIYFSEMLFGESPTMATEAAMLGVPAFYIDKTGRFYTTELEDKYNLVFNFKETEDQQMLAIEKAVELLQTPKVREEFQKRRQKMLSEKIDVTAFLVWFIENYPESHKTMLENPDFQNRFSPILD